METPKGELYWVSVDGTKKDLNGNLRHVASMRVKEGSSEHKQVAAEIDTYWQENKPKGKKQKSNGMKEEYDKEGNPTGYWLVNFWTGTTWKDGKSKSIGIYNAAGKPASLGDKKVGNGSIGRIKGSMGIYNRAEGAGVTLYLNAIQIVKLEEYSQDGGFAADESGEGWGGEEEDNWSSTPEEQPKIAL